METGEPIRRNSEIEDPTNLYCVHPISNRLTSLFAQIGIVPNAVSLAGMVFGACSGLAYYHYQNKWFAIAGFVLMFAWHVMDGVDGQLARLTGSQSPFGKVLDGICDYVTFTSVYIGLALALSRQYGSWVWTLVVVAGLFHALQAAIYEVQRQEYNFWGRAQKSAEFKLVAAKPPRSGRSPILEHIANRLHSVYLNVQLVAIGYNAGFRTRLGDTLRLRQDREASIRQIYREIFSSIVRRWSLMSANYRTLAIFVFSLLGRPLYYFFFEIVGLTLMMCLLLSRQHLLYSRFFNRLEAIG